MKPKVQSPIKLINNCGAIYPEKYLKEAMIWYAKGTLFKKKVISMNGKYPAVSIYKEKVHIHRLLMMYKHKTKFPTNIHIHHKDGNKLNSTISNLEVLSAEEHMSLTNKERVFTISHRLKIAEANKKRKGMKLKNYSGIEIQHIIPFLTKGWSINKIAKYLSVDWSTIKNRIHQHPELLNKQSE